MIRTPPANDAYRDAWDQVFGESEPEKSTDSDSDGIKMRVKSYLWHCKTCNALVSDPENHQYHVIVVTEAPAK